MVDAKIIDVNGKVLTGIRNIKKALKEYEDHHGCTRKEYQGKG